jgi:DNA-binding response OmpR family regulator
MKSITQNTWKVLIFANRNCSADTYIHFNTSTKYTFLFSESMDEIIMLLGKHQPHLLLIDTLIHHNMNEIIDRLHKINESLPIILFADDDFLAQSNTAKHLKNAPYILKKTSNITAIEEELKKQLHCSCYKNRGHDNINYIINNHTLTINNNEYHLRETDCKVLEFLLSNINQIIPYKDLITAVWGESHHKDPLNVLHCSISRLRRILLNENILIKSIYSHGYCIFLTNTR